MKPDNLKAIKLFLISVFCCLVLCSLVSSLLIKKTESTEVNKKQYSGVPYSSDTTVVLIKPTKLPVCFLAELSPQTQSSKVTAIPVNSVKNSNTELSQIKTKAEYSSFFTLSIDAVVELDNTALCKLIDIGGGITVDTPFGLPSPCGNGTLIADNEKLHIYGSTIISLMSAESRPELDRLKYYAELMALILKQFLSDFSEDKFLLLNENAKTDISFAEYYDNLTAAERSMHNISSSIIDGVWLNDKYYIM